MKEKKIENEIEKLEEQIAALIALRKEKINQSSRNFSKIWNILKRKETNENEIEKLEKEISSLSKELSALKAKISKSFGDLRSEIKNELKRSSKYRFKIGDEICCIIKDKGKLLNIFPEKTIELGGMIENEYIKN